MQQYRIADLTIEMSFSGEILRRHGKAYKRDTTNSVDMIIQVSDERLQKAQSQQPHLSLNEWEYILSGMDFARELLTFNGFCLHASAVAMDNRAVLFSGPCGIGKSTQASLWQQYFGSDRALIVNDDKPALRLSDDSFYVYGTPWSGKNDLSLNLQVPLQAIVFLQQAQENQVRRLSHKEAVQMLIYQSLRPSNDSAKMDKLLLLLDRLITCIPVYQMSCKPSKDAVKLIYHEINK